MHIRTHTNIHIDISVAVMEIWLEFECNSGENLCSHKYKLSKYIIINPNDITKAEM
jgi:hypothetical protein